MRAPVLRDGCWSWLVLVFAVASLPAGSLSAASPAGPDAGVPLPPGIPAWREPTTVELGASTLKVYSAMTTIPEEELIEFYQQTLPQVGWHLERLPWQAQQDAVIDRLQTAVKEHRDSSEASEMKEKLGEFRETQQTLQRQIYASRGADHVIVNLWPMGGEEKGTAIFINRWRGDQTWLEDSLRPAQQGTGMGANSWPQANVCCSGQTVPGMNVLPFLIPWYPQAKAVARSTSPDGATTVILMAPDAAEMVAAFYRAQMPTSGWKLVADDDAVGGGRRLSFQKPDRTCVLTIQAGTAAQNGTAAQTMLTLVASVRAAGMAGR